MPKAIVLLLAVGLLACKDKPTEQKTDPVVNVKVVSDPAEKTVVRTKTPVKNVDEAPVAPPVEAVAPVAPLPPESLAPVPTDLIPELVAPPFLPYWGNNFRLVHKVPRPERRPTRDSDDELDWLFHWNQIAIDASGLDHTPPALGEDRIFGQQLGPGRASRAMAIVHIAMFEAIIAIEGGYKSYTGLSAVKGKASVRAAIAQAAHDTLVALFSAQEESLDEDLEQELIHIKHGSAKDKGIKAGKDAAASILALRENDGSEIPDPLIGTGPGEYDPPVGMGLWSQDPISLIPKAIGAFWSQVDPFVLDSAQQFRAPPPPATTSPEYAIAFNETWQVGGDGVITPTIRTPDQTEIGIFWAYDGTPSLCAPPRLYNQVAVHIAKQEKTEFLEAARLLAILNIAMADSGIAGWESKFFYNLWRPVTAIRQANLDGNPNTAPDPTFTPLGAPASNLQGPNFTPPFPSYPSGHATFGGTLFQVLRKFYKRDNIAFTFTSDELNGQTKDNQGNVRPLKPRSFTSLSQAEEENGQSRMYLGIHWGFDKDAGITQGREIADLVLEKVYLPLK